MKVFIAVVASVTDYRKCQRVTIHCSSVHLSNREVQIAIMKAILQHKPSMAFDFPVQWDPILGENLITKERKVRLKEFVEKEVRENGWEEEDVPSDSAEFKAFERTK